MNSMAYLNNRTQASVLLLTAACVAVAVVVIVMVARLVGGDTYSYTLSVFQTSTLNRQFEASSLYCLSLVPIHVLSPSLSLAFSLRSTHTLFISTSDNRSHTHS